MKFLPWLCCVLLAVSAGANDPANPYDAGEEIYDGSALDTLAMTCRTRIDVETLRSISKNRPRRFSEDPLHAVQRLEVLATLVESHNAPPDLAAALQSVLPHARVIVDASGDILLKDKNSQLDLCSPMKQPVTVKSFAGKLSKLLESLSAQSVQASLASSVFSVPSFRKEFPLDPEIKIQDFDGTFRDLLRSIVSKLAKDTRYHALTTVDIDSQKASTQITINGRLDSLEVRLPLKQ